MENQSLCCRSIKKRNLNLYYAKRKAFINFVQKHRQVLWARIHLRRSKSGNIFRSDESTFQLVFGENGHRILHAKDEKEHPDCYQQSAKTSLCDGMGVHSAHGIGDLQICKGTIDADSYV